MSLPSPNVDRPQAGPGSLCLIAAPAQVLSTKESIAARLAEARERTLLLVEPLDDSQLNTVYSELLSPLAWDLGHIANFEELWLVRRVGGREPLDGQLGRLYDAIESPRAGRSELPILRGPKLRRYMAEVRKRTLEVLEEVDLLEADDPLLAGGFIYEMVIAHEHQHNETMLQALQLVRGYERPGRESIEAQARSEGPEMIALEGGSYEIGAAADGFAYDNERPCHRVELGPFEIDRLPVTNGDYAAFLQQTGGEPPMFWRRDGADGWYEVRFGIERALDPARPVIHVSWEEATAFAAWAGKRLPSELEWEAAAHGADPAAANLDQLAYGTAPAGSLPGTSSALGAEQMLGEAWEWTSSFFDGYPGFEPFPYSEYSEVFFDRGYRVLRGGSWATRPGPALRPSFRNWDLSIRKHIFAGLRCARSIDA